MAKSNGSKVVVRQKKNKLKYGKWGLIFILPFFIAYFIFQLYPLIMTFYKSFFREYKDPMTYKLIQEFIQFDNYKDLFKADGTFLKYLGNTFSLWLLGFIPQILVSLLFASWFTDLRLKLRGTGAMKVILYLPNMLMASSIAVLFAKLFATSGPINMIMHSNIDFLSSEWGLRGVIALVNFIMWTGNTTILLMAGIMGIDPALYEASSIDGASANQQFTKITLPMLKPIMLYVLVTSMIGGLQMFDIPNLIVRDGGTNQAAYTVVMDISKGISGSGDIGKAGAESVVLFLIAGLIGLVLFKSMESDEAKEKRANKKRLKAAAKKAKGVS
ncbi:carbohydrate ABC transporter permease [Eubacterium xylanophilum]|uniref:carbohydrate ABC transporter permease n=1 Tax=Eubacterium xylanophilum TaxID=39497 RepID=UPI00047B0C2B|nr:sugar ABC transporter permease [Eubacterium xylanophilum]